jgi:hypothetical protein
MRRAPRLLGAVVLSALITGGGAVTPALAIGPGYHGGSSQSHGQQQSHSSLHWHIVRHPKPHWWPHRHPHDQKVIVCHLAGRKYVKITIPKDDLRTHLRHGDVMPDEYGACP